jgi:hypothetical protein
MQINWVQLRHGLQLSVLTHDSEGHPARHDGDWVHGARRGTA